jgi:hypothetical protein
VSEFIFMLTRADRTVPDALAVYDSIRDTKVGWVGFKDIGQPVEVLDALTRRIHADGRAAVLEVVSEDEDSELGSVRAGLDIGVDMIMGGTHVDATLPLLVGRRPRYFPFPGRIVGHPSVLVGSLDEVCASATALSALPGVHGLDLLAYRYSGDVPTLIKRVVMASQGPVVAAGSIDSPDRIRLVTKLGVWGFTIGSAIFDGTLEPGLGVRDRIAVVLEVARSAVATAEQRPELTALAVDDV